MSLPTDTRSAAAILIRSLLPNLQQISSRNEVMEVAQEFKDGKLTLAIRAPAMAMARRLGANPVTVPDAARRLAEADLANVLNLGWFRRVSISADGSTMMFELK
ncbi:MAG TPA: hypothetical protein VHX12_07570 [Acidisoma sp.]|nr:hypothetical protein [Acidisoma sp.]